jgi:hypothetical protein
MSRRGPTPKNNNGRQAPVPILTVRQAELSLDLTALTPHERLRLDTAVMTLVEYLVSATAKAE